MNCIAIDDEPKALSIIALHAAKVPVISKLVTFRSGLDAIAYLNREQVDLMFLDISMPDITGLELLQSLTHKPMVIFTTAYAEYAVQSYEWEAVDYLLKPIGFPRFLKAVNKAAAMFRQQPATAVADTGSREAMFQVKSGPDIHQLKMKDILYVEAAGNYVTFVTPQRKVMTLTSLNEVQQQLPPDMFCRVHKSFIVSLLHIEVASQHQLKIGSVMVPVGRTYREDFLKLFGR